MSDKKNVGVILSVETEKKLRILAAQEGISKSELIRRLLEKGLEEEEEEKNG